MPEPRAEPVASDSVVGAFRERHRQRKSVKATSNVQWLWLPWRWRANRDADSDPIWGPQPSWWDYVTACWWQWRHKLVNDAEHLFVCTRRGHQARWVEPTEFDWHGHWGCERCPSWRFAQTDPWVEVWGL